MRCVVVRLPTCMGSCLSTTTARSSDDSPTTAKVITVAGALTEYAPHLTAAHVLTGPESDSYFLCSSDELFHDAHIPALGPEEQLQPGQIYFILPAEKLRQPLSGNDMKELLARASSALQLSSARERKTGEKRKRKKGYGILVPTTDLHGGDGEEKGVKSDNDKVDPHAMSSATVDRTRETEYGSPKNKASFRCRCTPGPMSAIPEVIE